MTASPINGGTWWPCWTPRSSWLRPRQGAGGGRDKLGCHHDRKNGGYHCHTGKLAGQSFPSKEAAQKALESVGME
jgi:hypothetical protein